MASLAANLLLIQGAEVRQLSRGYFQAMGIPLLDGRDFTLEDDRGPSVAVVNEVVTGLLSPNRTPLGQTIRVNDQTTLTVIGRTYGVPMAVRSARLLAAGMIAAYLPARRAAPVDAMTMLQSE